MQLWFLVFLALNLFRPPVDVWVEYIHPELETPVTAQASCVVKVPSGDIDADGRITIRDVLIALRKIVDREVVEWWELDRADLNLNGFLDVGDVVLILKRVLGSDAL